MHAHGAVQPAQPACATQTMHSGESHRVPTTWPTWPRFCAAAAHPSRPHRFAFRRLSTITTIHLTAPLAGRTHDDQDHDYDDNRAPVAYCTTTTWRSSRSTSPPSRVSSSSPAAIASLLSGLSSRERKAVSTELGCGGIREPAGGARRTRELPRAPWLWNAARSTVQHGRVVSGRHTGRCVLADIYAPRRSEENEEWRRGRHVTPTTLQADTPRRALPTPRAPTSQPSRS